MPQFCKDCAFSTREGKFSKCSNPLLPSNARRHEDMPKEMRINYVVTGDMKMIKPSAFYCSTARDYSDECGEEGKLFMSRPPSFMDKFLSKLHQRLKRKS